MIDDKIEGTVSEYPNANEELTVALEAFKIGMERSLGVCFPACVYSYDRSTHTAEVMPLIKMGYFNGEYRYIRRKPFKVTVRNIQCGGVTIDFPVYVGDTGWVISSDRDTTLIKQTGALTTSVLEGNRPLNIVEDDYQAKPHELLLHSFTSGFFIPDNWGMWENWRYKDNPTLAIGDSVYIGNSFDTLEDNPDSEGKEYQKGEEYENNPSSSLVLTKGGTIAMASSKAKKLNTRAIVESSGGRAKMSVSDDTEHSSSQIVLDSNSGITIRQDDEKNKTATIFNLHQGRTSVTMVSEDSSIQIFIGDGKINLSTSGAINVSAGDKINLKTNSDLNVAATGSVNVNTLGDARVTAQGNASVSATKDVQVNAGDNVNISTGMDANISVAADANINGGENVNIAAAKNINVASKDAVNIVTAGNTTVMSKKSGANILVTTLSKDSNIAVVAEGMKSNVSVTMKEEQSNLAFTMEKKDSPITITTKMENSPVNIVTEKDSDIVVNAANNINLTTGDGDVKAVVNGNLQATVKRDTVVSTGRNVSIDASGEGSISARRLTLFGGGASVVLEGSKATISSESLNFLGKDITLEDSSKGKNVLYS